MGSPRRSSGDGDGAGPAAGPATNPKRREVEQVYPLLTYHYGLTPAEIVATPRNIKEVYIAALPAIIAGEQLRAIEAASYAHMEEPDQKSIQAAWRKHLPEADDEAYAPRNIDELAMFAATAGIGVVVEKKAPSDAPATE